LETAGSSPLQGKRMTLASWTAGMALVRVHV
jgi:hypothetical protein